MQINTGKLIYAALEQWIPSSVIALVCIYLLNVCVCCPVEPSSRDLDYPLVCYVPEIKIFKEVSAV